MATLYIFRGLPGSGKSTQAKQLATKGVVHLEADMYFTNDKGEYVWDSAKLGDAHKWCLETCKRFLRNGVNVVVSNTFTQKWEVEAYSKWASDNGHACFIKKVMGNFTNVHGVPQDKLDQMKARWQDVDGERELVPRVN